MTKLPRIFACFLLTFACLATTKPAEAGWREDLGTFKIGMLADPGTERTIAGLSEIEGAFSAALNMPVRIFIAKNYAALIDAHATSRIDYAIYSTMAFATAQNLCKCLKPVAARLGAKGDVGIRSVLLVRNSAISEPGELRTVKTAYADSDSVAGGLLPMAVLAETDGLLQIDSAKLVAASSDTDALNMFLNGEVDGLFGWELADEMLEPVPNSGTLEMLEEKGVDLSSFSVPWRSDMFRYGPHAVRADIDDEAKSLLGVFLTGLADTKPDVLEHLTGTVDGGFAEVTGSHYDMAYRLIVKITKK